MLSCLSLWAFGRYRRRRWRRLFALWFVCSPHTFAFPLYFCSTTAVDTVSCRCSCWVLVPNTHTHTLRGNYYLRPLFLGRRTLLIASLTAGGTYLKCVYVSSNGRGNGNGRRDADSDTQKCEGPERCSDCGCGTATPNNTHQTTPLMSAPFSITEPSKKGKSCER